MTTDSNESSQEILVVTSKLKKYIKEKSGMSTSKSVMETISNKVRKLCDDAITHAEKEKRKTVMDKDFVSTDSV